MERVQRLVFGEDAALYDAARPSYPAAVVDEVVALVGGRGRALDVGCGTGKATTLLAARGLTGVGIEPHPAMAEVARRHLAGSPGWRVDGASFEEWEPAPGDAPFDLVTCAQAWHWLDPGTRLPRAAALLRPGGWLAVWWNRPGEDDDSPVRRAIDAAYEAHGPDVPARGIGAKGRPDPGPVPADGPVGPAVERRYRWSRPFTTAEWLDLLRTQSDHRMMEPDRLDRLLRAVAGAVDAHGGTYEHPFVTWLWAVPRR